jgi:hypothetical protein
MFSINFERRLKIPNGMRFDVFMTVKMWIVGLLGCDAMQREDEIKNVWICTSTPPYVSMPWCLVKYQGQLYLYLLGNCGRKGQQIAQFLETIIIITVYNSIFLMLILPKRVFYIPVRETTLNNYRIMFSMAGIQNK